MDLFEGNAAYDNLVKLQIIKERFPKGYSLKESSPFRGQVRAMSQNKKETQHKKKRSYNTSKNLIELVINGLEELGNPVSLSCVIISTESVPGYIPQ